MDIRPGHPRALAPWTSNLGTPSTNPLDIRPRDPLPSDIWWWSLKTCSNLFIWEAKSGDGHQNWSITVSTRLVPILMEYFLVSVWGNLRVYCELYNFGRTRNGTLTSHSDDIVLKLHYWSTRKMSLLNCSSIYLCKSDKRHSMYQNRKWMPNDAE